MNIPYRSRFSSFCLATKGTKGQGCEELQRHLLTSPKFGRVISESSSELPDLTKANLQIQPLIFFKAFEHFVSDLVVLDISKFSIRHSLFDIPLCIEYSNVVTALDSVRNFYQTSLPKVPLMGWFDACDTSVR